MRVLHRIACFVALMTLAGSLPAQEPFSFDATPGKLPKEVIPLSYEIRIQPDLDTLSTKGLARVHIEVRKPVDRIVLNTFKLTIASAVLEADRPTALAIDPDQERQATTLRTPEMLAPGKYTLRLDFSGSIGAQPVGLHTIKYTTPGERKTLLASKMEPGYARSVFPCWDEPSFRARFTMTAVIPANQTAVSNMPVAREKAIEGGLKEVTFAPTPPMASYLVSLNVGEFEALKGSVDGVALNVWTTPGKRATASYALGVTQKVLKYYNSYFGESYVLPKLDQIALPGGIPGAMEDWGAITYNEARLLYDPARSSLQTKQSIFRIVAHEQAHQWFGNLVTMAWWDDLWLNEAFAEWMSSKASDRFNPEWGVWLRSYRFTDAAMGRDARKRTHPIQQPIASEAEAVDAFDEITYGKGQAFIRMLENYLGEATFRRGIAKYIRAHRYSNATTADLWAALEQASGKPVRELAAGWTEQPGFPLVSVSATCAGGKRKVQLTQERFTLDDVAAAPFVWKIPVSLADGKSPLRVVLFGQKTSAYDYGDCSGTLRANAGSTGYYRVHYEPVLFDRLQANVKQLPTGDRLALLSDTWALVEAGRHSAATYLQLIAALKQERSLHVWERILGTLAFIDQLQQGEPGREAFQAYARALLAPPLRRLGWDSRAGEAYETTQLRARIIGALGQYNDPGVVQEARKRFELFLDKPESLAPDLREPVLYTVGRYATAGTYEQLHTLAVAAQRLEDKQLYYRALQRALAPELAQQTLALSLTDEMPTVEATTNPASVAKAGEHAAVAWDFVQRNFKALIDKVDVYGRNYYVARIMEAFSDTAHADELEAFVKANLPPSAVPIAARTAEAMRQRARLKKRELPVIDHWIERNGGVDKARVAAAAG